MAVKTIEYKEHTFSISYEIVNPDKEVDAVFLHGWGADKELMKGVFGNHLRSFRHIYIDLPGFGNSSSDLAMNTEDYANIIELFLAKIDAGRQLVVGHSFGGKVALLLNPEVLVLIASAGIYQTKSLGVNLKIGLFKLLNYIGLVKLREQVRSFFVADDAKKLTQPMYETFKTVVNESYSDRFEAFKNKALLLWGRDDTATPLDSGEQIADLIEDSRLLVYEGDHYFFMYNAEDISVEILKTYLSVMKY